VLFFSRKKRSPGVAIFAPQKGGVEYFERSYYVFSIESVFADNDSLVVHWARIQFFRFVFEKTGN
jgi:hypothetical protein